MKCSNLGIFSEVKIIQNIVHTDDRGFFLESFNKKKFFNIFPQEINFYAATIPCRLSGSSKASLADCFWLTDCAHQIGARLAFTTQIM